MSIATVLRSVQAATPESGLWAVIGAVARNAWAPPRATTDLDLTVVARAETLAAVAGALDSIAYVRVRDQRTEPSDPLPDILIFRNEHAELRQVDVLVAKTPFEADVVTHPENVRVGDLDVPVASPEAIVVYKLLADRPRDREDVRAILRTQARTARTFDWSYVERWTAFWQIGERLDRLRDELGSS